MWRGQESGAHYNSTSVISLGSPGGPLSLSLHHSQRDLNTRAATEDRDSERVCVCVCAVLAAQSQTESI